MQTSKTSPFDLRSNTLLYISEKVPFPDSAVTAHISPLLPTRLNDWYELSHGHAAVLFTSYKAMDIESVNHKSVARSIAQAIEKLRKIITEQQVLSAPSFRRGRFFG